jgi:two-component system, sensor histidine kinase PdtaS
MKNLITLFLFFASHTAFAQKTLPKELLHAIDTATTASSKMGAYIDVGDFYYQYFDAIGYSKAADYYEKARLVAESTKDSTLIGISYHSLAQVYDAVGEDKLPKALEYYTIFNRTTLKGSDTQRIIRSFINIAATQRRLGLKNNCEESLLKLTTLSQKFGKQKLINRSFVFAAYTFGLLEDYKNSRKYFDAINLASDTFYNSSLAYSNMFHLSKLYLLGSEKKFDEALQAGEDALKASSNASDSMNIYNQLVAFAKNAKNYEKAFEFTKQELDLYAKITTKQGLSSVNNSLLKSELNLKEKNAVLLLQKQQAQSTLSKWLTVGLVLMALALLGIVWLATIRRNQNISLAEKVEENNLLLKEVHHRVKNNLQIISSFMLLQQLKKNIDKDELIKQLQSKIQTLALIHQKLHNQSNYDAVELKTYFEQLFRETVFAFAINQDDVTYEINVADTTLNLDTLTPLALIINELLLNSIKHVSTKKKCHIIIAGKEEKNILNIVYADNGDGLPNEINFEASASTGLRLVKALTKQIKGTVKTQKIDGEQLFIFDIPVN